MVRSVAKPAERLDAAGLIEHRFKRAPLSPAPANPNAIGYGGLASYAASFASSGRHAAAIAAKIFQVATPANLPFQQPTEFDSRSA